MERTNSCGLKNLTFKQTKPFRATRQDDRDSFDRGASSLVSTAPRRIHAGRRLYCCPRSCVPGRPKPVGLSAAPVSIFERRYVTSGPSLQSHRAGAAEPRAPYRASDLVPCGITGRVVLTVSFVDRDPEQTLNTRSRRPKFRSAGDRGMLTRPMRIREE